jgi:hypothetical protein
MEIRLAEINVELANLKQDILLHKTDNRKDIDLIPSDIKSDIRRFCRRLMRYKPI